MNGATARQREIGFFGCQLDGESSEAAWLWEGYLAAGNVTLLTSQWKSGKTTLLSILLQRLKSGGELAGRTVRPASAVVVSEEGAGQWRPRHQKLDLGHVYFITLPFRGKPSLYEWRSLLEELGRCHAREPIGLLAIDTLTTFLPGRNENTAGSMMEALLPLRSLTHEGMSVLLIHHPAKGAQPAGQAARGSGALASFTDINMEMSWYTCGDVGDRRRRILAFSRHEESPRQLVIELNEAGDDYIVHGDFSSDEFTQNWERLRLVLQDARGKRTRRALREEWPEDFPCPHDSTLLRWLQRAVAAGLVCQEGTGRRSDPLRYWLPNREAEGDSLRELQALVEKSRRETEENLGLG